MNVRSAWVVRTSLALCVGLAAPAYAQSHDENAPVPAESPPLQTPPSPAEASTPSAPSDVTNPSSAPPGGNAGTGESSQPASSEEPSSSPAPARRVRRRHRRHHVEQAQPTVQRRRRRPRGMPRSRAPSVVIAARYTNLPTEGLSGPTWGFRLVGLPLAGRRDVGRYVRFALGGEIALRAASHDRTDVIVWSQLDLGFQYPTRYFVPFAAVVANFGAGERYRFYQPSIEFAWELGVEGGASIRPDAFLGLEIAAGVGRTQIGSQWSFNGWIRFGLAFF